MPIITVDGYELEVKAGTNLLDALLSRNIDVPYFCWHPAMGSIGACRQCAVVQYANKDDDRGRIVMSCMTAVTEGAIFSVDTNNAVTFRESVIENLMLNHPHDCPVCEEGGECHLQDMTVMVGHRNRQYTGRKTTFRNQYLGPFIGHEMNRCITCYRCTRFYQDYAGGHDLNAFGSRDRVFFGRAESGVLENEFAGNLIEVCPTGVFTDKTLSKNYTRKWDLQSAPTVCTGCSLGCNTYTSERYGELRRVHNRYNQEVNGYFLCDRGRFGSGYVDSPKRIRQAGMLNAAGLYDVVSKDSAIEHVRSMLANASKIKGIGSPRASLESNQSLRDLVGEDNYCSGMTNTEREMHAVILDVLRSDLNSPSMSEVENFDAVLVLGEDVTNHAPRLALSIRQATRNKSLKLAAETQLSEWQDAAVRELAQNQRSPLIVVTPMTDRLDEIASQSLRMSFGDITKLTQGLIDALTSDVSGEKQRAGSSESNEVVRGIIETLLAAERPLIVSGTSVGSPELLKRAANLAAALKQHKKTAGIFLCASEVNSLGVCLIDNHHSLESILDEAPEVVIVLENDLSLRLGHRFDSWIAKMPRLIAVDHLDHLTTSKADIVLPAATDPECEGSYINTEGRAQRSMAVFKPAGNIAASYHWLDALRDVTRVPSEIRAALANQFSELQVLDDAAPDEKFRDAGGKQPRMTHRSSGRTAMYADISVHEPKQPIDEDSAMAFSMEGNQNRSPSALRAYTWTPGWNSNQSIHKFQIEVNGSDVAANPPSFVFSDSESFCHYPRGNISNNVLIPQFHIFGSDELSAFSDELSQRVPLPYLRIRSEDAQRLGLTKDDGVMCDQVKKSTPLRIIIDDDLPVDCMVYPKIAELFELNGLDNASFVRIDGWHSPPAIITSDRTN
jgi:NADH-quinone oxidoreductase subunit G|tara:strand:+ start:6866 stop:9562 length:2697 start_codon:yes stop_codon:yes gene_type:complete